MTELTPDVDVVVVGGGIGGLSSALALAQAGLRVRVLEQAAQFGEVGAGLQIGPNGSRVLRSWGLLDEVLSLGVRPRHLIMRDALDGGELTRFDLDFAEQRYGAPYLVAHRSDLHGALLRACRRSRVDLVTSCLVRDVRSGPTAAVALSDGRADRGEVVIAADGLRSRLRAKVSDDQPISSTFVAYRGAVAIEEVADLDSIAMADVVVYVGPRCHFVQYLLRRGEMLNQVAVFGSDRADQPEWGTPEELDAAFAKACPQVQAGLPYLWRDRCWQMFDREPIDGWVHGRLVLTGDAAHPPLQYLAQGAVMAIEDAYVLAQHVRRCRAARPGPGSGVDWERALAAYNAVRAPHTRRVVRTSRVWGDLWHRDGPEREQRNAILRARDVHDCTYVDWLFGPTALVPEELAPPFPGESTY